MRIIPFLGKNGCNIYDARPDVCRRYSFLTPEGIVKTMQMEGGFWFNGAQCEASVDHAKRVCAKWGKPMPQPDEETKNRMDIGRKESKAGDS